MRDFKNMKRQRGRNRNANQGGRPQPHNANRSFESNGPEGIKVRGHAQSVYEKYQQLARDAFTSGDRVLAENYLQHSEHYFRVLRTLQPHRPPSDIVGRDVFSNGYDIDFEDETLDMEAPPPPPPEPVAQEGEGQRRDEFRRDEGRREEREFRREDRDRPRDEARREDRERERDRDRPRDRERPRHWGDRGERPPGEPPYGERRVEQTPQPAEAEVITPVVGPPVEMDTLEPALGSTETQLRSEDGGFSPAPAFLQGAAPVAAEAADEEVERKPRRRRKPRSFEGEAAAADAPATEDA